MGFKISIDESNASVQLRAKLVVLTGTEQKIKDLTYYFGEPYRYHKDAINNIIESCRKICNNDFDKDIDDVVYFNIIPEDGDDINYGIIELGLITEIGNAYYDLSVRSDVLPVKVVKGIKAGDTINIPLVGLVDDLTNAFTVYYTANITISEILYIAHKVIDKNKLFRTRRNEI